MATEAELIDALQKAHAAGEEDHARILANEIVKMRGEPTSTPAASAQGFQPSADIPKEPDTSLAQNLGVVNKAMSPYAAAALTGAALGAPVGGVGAPIGAGIGVMALGAGDLATHGYNAVAPMFGGKKVSTPSETIRNAMVGSGFATDPQTPEQNMLYQGVNGAASGLTGAAGFNALRGFATGTTGKILGQLGENPANQAFAGAGGALLPTAMNQYGDVTNPLSLTGASLAGTVLGSRGAGRALPEGYGGTPKVETPISAADLEARAKASFKAADNSGAAYDPQKFTGFVNDLKTKLANNDYFVDNPVHAPITALLKRADQATTEAQKLSWMHDFRQAIGRAGTNESKDVRRMAGMMGDEFDNFITNPDNATATLQPKASATPTVEAPAAPTNMLATPSTPSKATANAMKEWNAVTGRMGGEAPLPVTPKEAPSVESQAAVTKGSGELMAGINDWRKLSRSQEIEAAITKAQNNAAAGDKDFADTVRQQFKSIANNPNRMKKFSAPEQDAIRDLMEGNSSSAVTKALSVLAPEFKGPGVAATIAKLASFASVGGAGHGPSGAVVAPVVAGTVGYGANALRNSNALGAANALAANTRAGQMPITPFTNFAPTMPYISNTLTQD